MQTTLTPRQEFDAQLNEHMQNFRALLPSHIPVDKFKRVVVVAIAQTPALFRADRRSLFMAAQKCAADGLLPDGRQAALVIFGNQVEYLPMIAGIRQRMRNSGEVLSAEAHVVYRNDKFFQRLGDDPSIVHEPPAFGVDRGDPVGAYAIIKLKNGEVLREIMDKHQIEKVRSASRSKTGPAWTGWWDEMARKTVLRRCAKMAPTSADIDTLLSRDDDHEDASMVDVTPEPPRANSIAHIEPEAPAAEPDGPAYLVIDCDGEEHEFDDRDAAIDALSDVIAEATRRGSGHVAAARENNAELIDLAVPHSDGGGRTAGSIPATGATDSPAGNVDPNEPHGAVSTPAGDISDMFGGPARPAPMHHSFPLPRNPKPEDFTAFSDWIDAKLDDGVLGLSLRGDNKNALDLLKQSNIDLYLTIQRKLGAK